MWNRELAAAKKISVVAGKAIIDVYKSENISVEYKTDESPLTIADKKSNEIIIGYLKEKFPFYAILSEEEKDNPARLDNDFCFIVDPLDGTKEFLKRNGQFTVNIALSYKHEVVMGVIYVPVSGELYYATQDIGAFYIDSNGVEQQIYVSDTKDIKKLKAVISNSHGCKQMDELIIKYQLTDFVKVGSSLKGCMVAKGDADIYYRFNPTMEWDTAAMQCIVEAAGGYFRQMDGSKMLYNRINSLNDKGFFAINHKCNLLTL